MDIEPNAASHCDLVNGQVLGTNDLNRGYWGRFQLVLYAASMQVDPANGDAFIPT